MHIGKAIQWLFKEQGKKKYHFAIEYGKSNDLIAVHQKKQHMNTYLVSQYAKFFGLTLRELIIVAEGFE